MEGKVFKVFELPEVPVLRQTPCDLEVSGVRKQGNLYITEDNVLFYSKIAGKTVKLLIPFSDIQKLNKLNTALVVPNAIEFITSIARHFFSSFSARDEIYEHLCEIWRRHNPAASEPEPAPVVTPVDDMSDSSDTLASSSSSSEYNSKHGGADPMPPSANRSAFIASVPEESPVPKSDSRFNLPHSDSHEIAKSQPSMEKSPRDVPQMPSSFDDSVEGEQTKTETPVASSPLVESNTPAIVSGASPVEERSELRSRISVAPNASSLPANEDKKVKKLEPEKSKDTPEEKKGVSQPSPKSGYPLWVHFSVPVAVLGFVVVARYLTH